MIPVLARALLTRRLRSLPRLLFIVVLAGQDLAHALLSGGTGPAEGALASIVTALFGAGMLGQERSDGSLALWLTRPVSRSQVVLAGWLATAASGTGAWFGLTVLRLPLALLPGVDLNASASDWCRESLAALAGPAGLAAVIVLFGVVVRGLGGIAAQLGLAYLMVTLAGLAQDSGRAGLKSLAEAGLEALLPVPRFAELLAPGGWSWLGLVTPASNATLALLLACLLLGRAQLSYSGRD